MAPRCCTVKGLRMIRVGDSKAGVTGLDRILEETCNQGWQPEQEGFLFACAHAYAEDHSLPLNAKGILAPKWQHGCQRQPYVFLCHIGAHKPAEWHAG